MWGSTLRISRLAFVVGSVTLARTRCPPPFTCHTPGTSVGATMCLQRRSHFTSFIATFFHFIHDHVLRSVSHHGRQTEEVAIEVVLSPHQGLRSEAASCGMHTPIVLRLSQPSRRLEPAVAGGLPRGEERLVQVHVITLTGLLPLFVFTVIVHVAHLLFVSVVPPLAVCVGGACRVRGKPHS